MSARSTHRDERRVNRVVGTLSVWTDHRIKGDLLTNVTATIRDSMSGNDLHRLWPIIEQQMVKRHGLYLIRPLAWTQYGIIGSTQPGPALAQKWHRDLYMRTMMLREINERMGNLQKVIDSPGDPHDVAAAVRSLSRHEAWLDSFNRDEDEMRVLIAEVETDVRVLPWVMWDPDGERLYSCPVGPNGLPLNGHR